MMDRAILEAWKSAEFFFVFFRFVFCFFLAFLSPFYRFIFLLVQFFWVFCFTYVLLPDLISNLGLRLFGYSNLISCSSCTSHVFSSKLINK